MKALQIIILYVLGMGINYAIDGNVLIGGLIGSTLGCFIVINLLADLPN